MTPRSRPRDRHRSRIRAVGRRGVSRRIHLLPHLFTIGNLFAGYFAITSLLQGSYDLAAMAIGVGIALDGLDGAAARLVHSDSAIGVQLDSLADVVTFGIAPAFLALAWGTAGLDETVSEYAPHIRRLGWIASFAYLAACTLRLARFNVLTSPADLDEAAQVRGSIFRGMPTPTAAGCIAVVVHLLKAPLAEWIWAAIWVVCLFVLAGLMVSRIPFPKPKLLLAGRLSPRLQMLALALLLAAVYYYSEVVLAALLLTYLIAVEFHNLRGSGAKGRTDVRTT